MGDAKEFVRKWVCPATIEYVANAELFLFKDWISLPAPGVTRLYKFNKRGNIWLGLKKKCAGLQLSAN